MAKVRTSKVLNKFIIEMIKNRKKLNNDLDNNFSVCKSFCDKTIEKSQINFEVHGKENVPIEGPTLITSNHKSFYDILLLVSALDRSMPFAAAKELDKIPLLRRYLEGIRCVLIDRKSKDIEKMREQLNNMNNAIMNTGLILFPEGECSYLDEETKEFKKGGFMGVMNKNVEIVPAYIESPDMTKFFKWYVPHGDVSVTFGEPFIPEEELGTRAKAKDVAIYTREKVLQLRK